MTLRPKQGGQRFAPGRATTLIAVLGKTEPLNAGSGTAAESFSSTSLSSANGHLVRLVRLYLSYYHEDRCHLGLDKDTPNERPVTPRPSPAAKIVALRRVGGLHHRYEWREAA